MTMVSSGPISLAGTATSGGLNRSIEVELGGSGTSTISLNNSNVRTLAGVPSGAISLSNFYGKSNRKTISYTFSSTTINAALNLSALSGYVAGLSDITITINSGVYLYSTNVVYHGLTITGGTTGDTLTIINNGYIMGLGGDGSSCDTTLPSLFFDASPGGPALAVAVGISSCTIDTRSGYIGGGGGGGGWGQAIKSNAGGGGGAGGGKGGYINFPSASPPVYVAGAVGGGPGSSGSNGVSDGIWEVMGGAGGRIMPGTTTSGVTSTSSTLVVGLGGQGGGSGAAGAGSNGWTISSGSGGGGSSAGGTGAITVDPGSGGSSSGGGGGGYGASGGNGLYKEYAGPTYGNYGFGAPGGNAVDLYGNSVTWTGGFPSSRVFGAVI